MDPREPYPHLTDADLDEVIADWPLAGLERLEEFNAGMIVTDLDQVTEAADEAEHRAHGEAA